MKSILSFKERKQLSNKKYRGLHPDKKASSNKKWYEKNKKRYRLYGKKANDKVKKLLYDIKKNLGCKECRMKNPVCLDFHHRDPNEKEFSVGEAYAKHVKLERILKEIKKCDVLCKNCHAVEEWGRYYK